MGWNTPDVYHQPEKFGLTVMGTVERYEPDYSFDFVVVWYHEDGSFYVGHDSGCSCPSPFEDFDSLDKLDKVSSWTELQEKLMDLAPQGSGTYYSGNRSYEAEVSELVAKVREASRG